MELFSSAYRSGDLFPALYTCDGKNISPPLAWSDVPAAAKSLVLILYDPDAPSGNWIHWILYNLPPSLTALDDNLQSLPSGAEVGLNSWKRARYDGPCPPPGRHRYIFRLYALDTVLDIKTTIGAAELFSAMQGHVLAQSELMGLFR